MHEPRALKVEQATAPTQRGKHAKKGDRNGRIERQMLCWPCQTIAMLSAFTARPIVELKQRDKSKIESILAYGIHVNELTWGQGIVLTLGR